MTYDEITYVLNHVIEHLKEKEPTRTLTARNLIMRGMLEFERENATRH